MALGNAVMDASSGLGLILSTPFIGASLMILVRRAPVLRDAVTMITSVSLFILVAMLPSNSDGAVFVLAEPISGLPISFGTEPFGKLFAFIASGLWIVTSIYSIGYLGQKTDPNKTRYFVCFALSLGSTMGIAFAANLFTLFIFYEALTLVTYPLVAHYGTPESRNGARKYLQILLGSSIALFVPGIIIVYLFAGTLDFQEGGVLNGKLDPAFTIPLLLMFLYGVAKSAVMPVHSWLPSAMVAPAPVSALLHAVAVVKAGVFTITKIIAFIFGWEMLASSPGANLPLYIAGFTVIAASVHALQQDNIKSMLAYSTIAQLSYVVMAASLFLPIGGLAAALHIAAHAVAKITLFFVAGAIYLKSGYTLISQLNGIGRNMPLTLLAFTIAAASMIGLPPTAGFFSKWFLLQAAFTTESYFTVGVITISTALNAAYFLPILYRAFFKAPNEDQKSFGEAPWPVLAALLFTAALSITFLAYGNAIMELEAPIFGSIFNKYD